MLGSEMQDDEEVVKQKLYDIAKIGRYDAYYDRYLEMVL